MALTLEIIDRGDEGAGPVVPPSWDSRWVIGTDLGYGGCADWFLADPVVEPLNAGGFSAVDPYGTAIILCLFTDRRRIDGLPGDVSDYRGWHGDTFDIDEAAHEGPIGSWLWTLEREALTADIVKLAEYFATDALMCLVRQGAAQHVEAEAEVDNERGFLMMTVRVYIERSDAPYQLVVPVFPI